MKLSKYNLKVLLRHSAWDELSRACDNGTLEIEGYVREDHLRDTTKMVDEWTKFDPDDPKTFPPELTRVLAFDRNSGKVFIEKFDVDLRVWLLPWCVITHWRPLPKLPLEIDGRYIREDRPECLSYDRKV